MIQIGQPILHKALVDRAVEVELTKIEGMIQQVVADRLDYFKRDWRLKLERVYAEGLRDGFVQGVGASRGL